MTRIIGGHTMDGHDTAGTYQPNFDWNGSRAAGDELAAYKGTQATGFTDPWFARNRAATSALGFRYRGIYHWQAPGVAIESQLAHFVAVVGDLQLGEFIQLDQEESGLTLDECVRACELWSQRYPGRVAHYGGAYFGWPGGHGHPRLAPWPWWLAAYQAVLPRIPYRPVIWQWGGFTVPGHGSVDANQIIDRPALEILAGYPSGPPSPEEPDVYRFVRRQDRTAVYLSNLVTKVWMTDPATYQRKRAALAALGIPDVALAEHEVADQADLDLWGVTVGADPGDV